MNTVLYIISLSHSGSTLLGSYLNAHPKIINLGEIKIKQKDIIRCIFCEDNECPIWNTILTEELVRKNHYAFKSNKKSKDIEEKPGAIYKQIFNLTDNKVVVDSTKDINWMLWNSKSKDFNTKAIFLFRDLRGVVASWKKRSLHIRDGDTDRIVKKIKKNLNSKLKQINKIKSIDILNLKYEDLVEDPKKYGEKISNFCGLNFSEKMNNFYDYPNHVLGGNRGTHSMIKSRTNKDFILDDKLKLVDEDFYLKSSPGFKLDERWKSELSTDDLKLIDKTLINEQKRLGYK